MQPMLDTIYIVEIIHNLSNCQDIKNDGTFRTIRHEHACFTKRSRYETKLSRRNQENSETESIFKMQRPNSNCKFNHNYDEFNHNYVWKVTEATMWLI